MEKLDGKDRKILYYLDFDSRQSFSQVGKKVGLHKDVVAYHVKKLQEKGVIKNFYTEINNQKLGYSEAKFYLTYQNVTPEIKQEIIDYLVNCSYTDIIHTVDGQYDLVIISSEKDIAKFYNIWTSIINKYRDFFSNQIFCVECICVTFKKTFLLNEKTEKKGERILHSVSYNDDKVELDDLDYKILERLAPDSRIQTRLLAEQLKSSVNTITSKIKKLVQTGVITRFTVNVDWPKIGYQWFKVDIVLKNPEKIQQITGYIQNNPHLLYRVESLGYVDLELTFILQNENQVYEIMEDLTSKFPDEIKNYKYFSVIQTHKFYGVDFWNR